MKFKNFSYILEWTWIMIFPTITILKDEQQYMDRNFSIQLHWLGFHFRWFWLKEMSAEKVIKIFDENLKEYK